MMNQGSQAEQSQSNINEQPLVYKIKQYRPKTLLSQFSYMLIRPPRFLYNEQLLNPPQNYQIKFKVQQHSVPFKLTLYKVQNMLYVILYLHGNSSSRFQGYMHLKELPEGVGLACFDFSGCGLRNQSQFITLGKKQSKQVDIAAKYLKGLGYKVVGWGRSMGSVSLLLSEECDILVADSPFYSLADLCKQSSQKFVPSVCCCFFHCLYPCLFSCVRSDVQQKAGFDVQELEVAKLIQNNPRNKQRSLFLMAGIDDNMIHYSHSQKIFDAFPGKKKIQLFHGTHNSQRPAKAIDNCFVFIQSELGISLPPPKTKNVKLKPINIQTKQTKISQIKIKKEEPIQKTKIQEIQLKKIHHQQSDLSLMNKQQNDEVTEYKTLTAKHSKQSSKLESKATHQISKITTNSTIKDKDSTLQLTQIRSKSPVKKIQTIQVLPSSKNQIRQDDKSAECKQKEKKETQSNEQTPSLILKQ